MKDKEMPEPLSETISEIGDGESETKSNFSNESKESAETKDSREDYPVTSSPSEDKKSLKKDKKEKKKGNKLSKSNKIIKARSKKNSSGNKDEIKEVNKEDEKQTNGDHHSLHKKTSSIKESWLTLRRESRKNQPIKLTDEDSSSSDKHDPARFLGEGVSFKAKLIGVLEVSEARGDRVCQEALAELKMAIKAAGEHKQKVMICVAIDGLRIRDEKTGDCLYHHPVHKISFIAQDMTDARAFGYIFGSPDTGHRFFGIKTEKAANQVVIAMRDLFQVVFELKKKEIERAKQQLQHDQQVKLLSDHVVEKEKEPPVMPLIDEPKMEAIKEEPRENGDVTGAAKVPGKGTGAVADLLDLEIELDSLQQGIDQMEKITPSDPFGPLGFGEDPFRTDPFGDSFTPPVSAYPFKDPFDTGPFSPPSSMVNAGYVRDPFDSNGQSSQEAVTNLQFDKYAVFSDPTSVLDNTTVVTWNQPTSPPIALEEPDLSETTSPVLQSNSLELDIFSSKKDSVVDLFTDLDPLGTGKNKPYVDKKDFFHELKNPPKKVLKDLLEEKEKVVQPSSSQNNKVDASVLFTSTSRTHFNNDTICGFQESNLSSNNNSDFNTLPKLMSTSDVFVSAPSDNAANGNMAFRSSSVIFDTSSSNAYDPFIHSDPFAKNDPFVENMFQSDPFTFQNSNDDPFNTSFADFTTLKGKRHPEVDEHERAMQWGPLRVALPPEQKSVVSARDSDSSPPPYAVHPISSKSSNKLPPPPKGIQRKSSRTSESSDDECKTSRFQKQISVMGTSERAKTLPRLKIGKQLSVDSANMKPIPRISPPPPSLINKDTTPKTPPRIPRTSPNLHHQTNWSLGFRDLASPVMNLTEENHLTPDNAPEPPPRPAIIKPPPLPPKRQQTAIIPKPPARPPPNDLTTTNGLSSIYAPPPLAASDPTSPPIPVPQRRPRVDHDLNISMPPQRPLKSTQNLGSNDKDELPKETSPPVNIEISLTQLASMSLGELANVLHLPSEKLSHMTIHQLAQRLAEVTTQQSSTGEERESLHDMEPFIEKFETNFSPPDLSEEDKSVLQPEPYDKYAVFREIAAEEAVGFSYLSAVDMEIIDDTEKDSAPVDGDMDSLEKDEEECILDRDEITCDTDKGESVDIPEPDIGKINSDINIEPELEIKDITSPQSLFVQESPFDDDFVSSKSTFNQQKSLKTLIDDPQNWATFDDGTKSPPTVEPQKPPVSEKISWSEKSDEPETVSVRKITSPIKPVTNLGTPDDIGTKPKSITPTEEKQKWRESPWEEGQGPPSWEDDRRDSLTHGRHRKPPKMELPFDDNNQERHRYSPRRDRHYSPYRDKGYPTTPHSQDVSPWDEEPAEGPSSWDEERRKKRYSRDSSSGESEYRRRREQSWDDERRWRSGPYSRDDSRRQSGDRRRPRDMIREEDWRHRDPSWEDSRGRKDISRGKYRRDSTYEDGRRSPWDEDSWRAEERRRRDRYWEEDRFDRPPYEEPYCKEPDRHGFYQRRRYRYDDKIEHRYDDRSPGQRQAFDDDVMSVSHSREDMSRQTSEEVEHYNRTRSRPSSGAERRYSRKKDYDNPEHDRGRSKEREVPEKRTYSPFSRHSPHNERRHSPNGSYTGGSRRTSGDEAYPAPEVELRKSNKYQRPHSGSSTKSKEFSGDETPRIEEIIEQESPSELGKAWKPHRQSPFEDDFVPPEPKRNSDPVHSSVSLSSDVSDHHHSPPEEKKKFDSLSEVSETSPNRKSIHQSSEDVFYPSDKTSPAPQNQFANFDNAFTTTNDSEEIVNMRKLSQDDISRERPRPIRKGSLLRSDSTSTHIRKSDSVNIFEREEDPFDDDFFSSSIAEELEGSEEISSTDQETNKKKTFKWEGTFESFDFQQEKF